MLGALLQLVLPCCLALHPRPEWKDIASYARWLVHESDYASVSTHHNLTEVFGNIISISDGNGYEDSNGIILTYIPSLDATYMDLQADNRVSLTFSEMALANGTSGGCYQSTAENPPCGRVTISGRLTPVPKANQSIALRNLFARHPVMKEWSQAHMFQPFWLAPENITGFFVIDMYGGSQPITTKEYLDADWHRKVLPKQQEVCNVCGHVYDPQRDGAGKRFEDLPDTWTCPICGARKSSYKKTTAKGQIFWAHEDHVSIHV